MEFAAIFGLFVAVQVAVQGGMYIALRHQITDLGKNVQAQIDRGKQEHDEFRRDIKELQGNYSRMDSKLETVIQLLREKNQAA